MLQRQSPCVFFYSSDSPIIRRINAELILDPDIQNALSEDNPLQTLQATYVHLWPDKVVPASFTIASIVNKRCVRCPRLEISANVDLLAQNSACLLMAYQKKFSIPLKMNPHAHAQSPLASLVWHHNSHDWAQHFDIDKNL